jgi:hypothetical protein
MVDTNRATRRKLLRIREIMSELAWDPDPAHVRARTGADDREIRDACDVVVRILDDRIRQLQGVPL